MPVFLILLSLILGWPGAAGSARAASTLVPPGARITDREARLALADAEAVLGHAEASRDLYLGVLARAKGQEELRLRFAGRMVDWGDFYRAEAIYRQHLRRHPGDAAVSMRLAALLRSCERYEEAEGLYRERLLEAPEDPPALLGLARVKRLEWRLDEAGELVERFLELRPGDPEGRLLRAEIALLGNRHDRAFEAYAGLRELPGMAVPSLLGMGRVRRNQGDEAGARAFFERACELSPESVEARFRCAGPGIRETGAFVEALLFERPAALVEWARLYAAEGNPGEAVRCCEAALEQDPRHFPARVVLAEALAADRQYDRAARVYEELADAFPENRKALVGRARTLGWGRRYDESLALYDRIHALAPDDPVPVREKARTAVWAKRMDLALETYERLLTPPVDGRLASAVTPVAAAGNGAIREPAERLNRRAGAGAAYDGYEAFSAAFESVKADLEPGTRKRIERELTRFLPEYRLQKGASLEKRAKELAWDLRFHRALRAYEALTQFAPADREALMDRAQVQCALGLCEPEAETYRELLDIDPQHEMARRALDRLEIVQRPSLEGDYAYWNERGRDRLSGIERQRADLALKMPVGCRLDLMVVGHHWIERPDHAGQDFEADGFTLAASVRPTPFLEGEAAWTRKDYREEGIETRDTGHARVYVDLLDALRLGAGFERSDELYNVFGIEQGIQADAWWVSASSRVTRRLNLLARARDVSYSDDNEGRHVLLEAGYALTDHPRLLEVTGFAERRDTEEQNVYRFQGEELVDITHPYWTPEDYYAGGIRIEWHHDLSGTFLCRSRKHAYDLTLTLGTDNEDNPHAQLAGEWRWDLLDRWTLEIRGLVHRSDLWDAEGLWTALRCRF